VLRRLYEQNHPTGTLHRNANGRYEPENGHEFFVEKMREF
jgi:hypothetical protein